MLIEILNSHKIVVIVQSVAEQHMQPCQWIVGSNILSEIQQVKHAHTHNISAIILTADLKTISIVHKNNVSTRPLESTNSKEGK